MSKAVWNPYYTRVFCDICMEEVNGNNREGGCLSRKGYKNLGDKFAEKTGDRRTQKQFKNKWDAMKKDYTRWMELQNATGLGWDPIAKTMDADDDWWKNHLAFQIRPDHAKFRNGPPANLEQQDVMFRKAHVTGESAAIAGEEEETDNEAPIMLDDDTCGQASSKKTGKRKHVEKDFFSAYNNALNTIVSRHTDGSSGSKGDEVPTMKEFLGMVRDCGVLEGTDIMYTAGKLAMNKDQREVFAAFATIEGRLDWLQRTHDEMDDGDDDREYELERTRQLLGVAHDLAMLGYYGNLYSQKYLNKEPRRIPEQTGLEWVNEQLGNRKRCYKMFRMYPNVFHELHNLLVSRYGLVSTRDMSSVECLAMFLWMVGGPQSFSQVENHFSRSTETIHRKFHMVLNCLNKLGKDNIKPVDRNFKDVHRRLQDARFWPHFKDAIGAIDGSNIPVEVPAEETVNHTGRHGYTSQNILAICDFDLRFTFVVAGWPSSAHDTRILERAIEKYPIQFPTPPGDTYYLFDSGYPN